MKQKAEHVLWPEGRLERVVVDPKLQMSLLEVVAMTLYLVILGLACWVS